MNTYQRWLAPALAGGCGIASCAALFAFFDYPLFANWGTLSDERDARLPGDELLPGGLQSTRAITVDAPPNDVWPWLVQMGQDRGGFYSHDWLERLFGADIHNAHDINPDWQQLAVGDAIWPYPERKLRAMAKRSGDVGGWTVVALEPSASLVVQSVTQTLSQPSERDHPVKKSRTPRSAVAHWINSTETEAEAWMVLPLTTCVASTI